MHGQVCPAAFSNPASRIHHEQFVYKVIGESGGRSLSKLPVGRVWKGGRRPSPRGNAGVHPQLE
jgi:hypothetical protein